MRSLALLLVLSALAPALSRADCECLWQGSFTDVQATTDLVVAGKVVASKGNSIDLAVSRTLRGSEPIAPVRVWMRRADYCRPEAELFPLESQWVMALEAIRSDVPGGFDPGTPNISYGRVGDYYLSSCGGYWLHLLDNRVSGNLVKAPRWERDPAMTPVLLDLVADFIDGKLDSSALEQASKEDPALRELMLDTREFLRKEN